MLLAVLNRHAGVPLGDHDVFVNIVGGLRVERDRHRPAGGAGAGRQPARPRAARPTLVAFGEIGLTGEVRPVAHGEERLRELQKQGYQRVILPADNAPRTPPEGLRDRCRAHAARGAGRGVPLGPAGFQDTRHARRRRA